MENESRKSYGFAFAVWITPWLFTALSCFLNPELFKTFFTTPMGLIVTAVVFVWETIGCLLLVKGLPAPQELTQKRGFLVNLTPKLVLVILIFVAPAFLLPMLGPTAIMLLGILAPQSP